MLSLDKRAIWPSFFVMPGLLLALVTSTFEGYIFYWLGIVCLVFPLLIGLPRKPGWNKVTACVLLFITWLLIHIFFISPAFTTKGLYFVGFLLAGFLLASCLSRGQVKVLFIATIAVFSLLSVWAVIQYLTGSFYLIPVHPRVNTIFFTPNTFAAAINLAILPLLVIYLSGSGRHYMYLSLIILFTALLLTGSRGGWLAFLAAICVGAIGCLVQDNVIINRQRTAKLGIAFMIVIALFITTKPLVKQADNIDGSSLLRIDQINIADAMRIKDSMNSVNARLKIFDIAWQRIKQKPWLGYGYNHFQYYQLSDQDMSRMGKLTKFVHNDYLQIWFETGLPGLVLLMVLILVLYRTLFHALDQNDNNRIIALGLLGTFTAYFTHALVDFVMYPPVLLLMFGACLGVAGSVTDEKVIPSGRSIKLSTIGIRPAVARWATGVLFLALLSQPVLSQIFYDRANRDKQRLDMENALMFYELARRFAPWEPDYYSVEGDIWRHAALVTGEKEPAGRADELFQQGIQANPFRMESLYLRALLHRDLSHLLSNPAGEETVLRWFETIMQWHPHDIPVKLDFLLALKQYGWNDRADALYDKYLQKYPRSRLLQDFENVYDRSVIKRNSRTGGETGE